MVNYLYYPEDFTDWSSLVEKINLAPSEWGIVCPCGTGDTYFVCALAKRFLSANGGEKITVIVKPSHEEIPKLFTKYISRIIAVSHPAIQAMNGLPRYSCLRQGYPIIGHPYYFGSLNFIGYKGLHLLDLYRYMFHLAPNKTLLKKPTVTAENYLSARTKFDSLNLPKGKTVILAPDANSTKVMPMQFWELLAQKLLQQGWAVCTNMPGNKLGQVPGTIPISFSIGEAIPTAELAGWVISSRSGFCDIISSAKCRLSVIYPKQVWYSGTVLTGCGLKIMGLSRTAIEYEVSENDDWETAIVRIVDKKIL